MIDDDEAYGLRCDIGRLEQENATLRQQLEDVTASMSCLEERHAKTFEVGKRWMAKAARFESENIKLRELVRDMMRYYFMPSAIDSKQRETDLLERAHELGVEKDNGELWAEVDK